MNSDENIENAAARHHFLSPDLEQDTVEALSHRLLEVTEQLSAGNRSLKRLQKERSEMLANLSHDLRAPLTAIRSTVDYLNSGQPLTNQDLQNALQLIDHRTSTLEHLIRDMYELFTLEDPSRNFSFQELDALSFLEEYFYAALPDSRYAAHTMQLQVSPTLHATLFADPGKLVRVLDNLLSNAAKYAPPHTRITLGAALSADASSLQIFVTDFGPGIPPKDLEHIFRRTYTVSSARTPNSATGSGLGLAIVSAIVKRHGGTVSCQSVLGSGSTFTVTLPVKASGSPGRNISGFPFCG